MDDGALVPVGELECWLRNLGVERNKSQWLIEMFDRMGSDPTAADYVHPGPEDVWGFIRSVGRWIRDPNRKGMV